MIKYIFLSVLLVFFVSCKNDKSDTADKRPDIQYDGYSSLDDFSKIKPAKVDELFEFTSIVWRLAEAEEYSRCDVKSYVKDINKYFDKSKGHPLIAYCKEIRQEQGIGYDAVSSGTEFLLLDNGVIKFADGYNAESVEKEDRRWTSAIFTEYLDLMNDFYAESGFHEFFADHELLYKEVEEKLNDIVREKIKPSWFEDFYGSPFPEISLFISINNGYYNYSLPSTNRKGVLMGGVKESDGKIDFVSYSALPIVIHEITHIYVNPIIHQYKDLMTQASIKAFECKESVFRENGIGYTSIPYEWLTRLFSLSYIGDMNKEEPGKFFDTNYYVSLEYSSGFCWMPRSFYFMRHFYDNRDKYKTIGDFIPQLVASFNYNVLEDYDNTIEEYRAAPYIVEVFPAPGSKLDLDQDTVRIEVKFSREMNTGAEGISLLTRNKIYTKGGGRTFWLDSCTYAIYITPGYIRKTGFYGFQFYKGFIQSSNFYSIPEEYQIVYDDSF